MRNKAREEILGEVGEQIKAMVKELLERLMQEERALYLAKRPIKVNEHYIRDLLTLVSPLENLEVPRVREGTFHPKLLTYRRRTYLELSEAIYAAVVSTRSISRFLEGICGAFYSPQSISRLAQVVEEEGQTWRERPPDEEYYAVFPDGTFLSIRQGKTAKEPVYGALGIKPVGRRETLEFSGRKGRAPGTERRS